MRIYEGSLYLERFNGYWLLLIALLKQYDDGRILTPVRGASKHLSSL